MTAAARTAPRREGPPARDAAAGAPGPGPGPAPGFTAGAGSPAALKVSGGQAAEFLHGQFTTDVAGLAAGAAALSAWCDPRGRVIAAFILARLERCFWLFVPPDLKEALRRRLEMYVLRADVQITDPGERLTCLGIVGAETAAAALFPGWAAGSDWCAAEDDDGALVRGPAGLALALAGGERARSLLEDCRRRLPEDEQCWEKAVVRLGIPWLSASVSGRFLPQELNLDDLGALDYHKGCYPGQEVIARLHYRGAPRRRLRRATTRQAPAAAPGAALTPAGEDRNIGAVLNAAPSGEDSQELLIVLDRDFPGAGRVVAAGSPGSPVVVGPPPEPAVER